MSRLAEIEALLYVAGEDGLQVRQLAELLEMAPTALLQSLEKLREKYAKDTDSSLQIIETAQTYRLVTKERHAALLRHYARTPVNQSMSRASLETLSIIAYKQPITRIEVDEIRGVNSSSAIAKLLSYQLIEETGRKETIGRPHLYGTTPFFLDYLGINNLSELPVITDIEDLVAEEHELFGEEQDENK